MPIADRDCRSDRLLAGGQPLRRDFEQFGTIFQRKFNFLEPTFDIAGDSRDAASRRQ